MSGAKNCPETPRQKMIGMMYLVLTAMLALNVSSEILNGFSMVDESLHTTISSAEQRNSALYDDFKDLFDKNPTKVKEWLDLAMVVKKKSDDLFNYIEDFKVQIVRMTDKKDANDSAFVRDIKGKDNLDKAGEYALVKGNGIILKQKIEEYRNFLVGLSSANPSKQKIYKVFLQQMQVIQVNPGKLPFSNQCRFQRL
jgi:gliding motility-associated protein GldM